MCGTNQKQKPVKQFKALSKLYQELLNADKYEVSAYKRVSVTLASGVKAWAYVDALDTD